MTNSAVALLKQNRLAKLEAGRDVAQPQARAAAKKVHVAGVEAEIARRIKDASKLESALLDKLEGQRDFAAEYKAKFPQGRPPEEIKDASTGVFKAEAYCQGFGFAFRTVQRWCELLDAGIFNARKNAILDKCWQLAELWQAANYSSESVEWYTPARYLEAVREVLGGIDLDPASNALADGACHFIRGAI